MTASKQSQDGTAEQFHPDSTHLKVAVFIIPQNSTRLDGQTSFS